MFLPFGRLHGAGVIGKPYTFEGALLYCRMGASTLRRWGSSLAEIEFFDSAFEACAV